MSFNKHKNTFKYQSSIKLSKNPTISKTKHDRKICSTERWWFLDTLVLDVTVFDVISSIFSNEMVAPTRNEIWVPEEPEKNGIGSLYIWWCEVEIQIDKNENDLNNGDEP